MATASGSEDVKEEEPGSDSRLVKVLDPFEVKLVLKQKKSTVESTAEGGMDSDKRELVFMSLMHKDTFNTFEGLFSKDNLVKLGFDPRSLIECDLLIIQDAFYGRNSDSISLECGFLNLDDDSDEVELEYFDGAHVLVNVKEVCRRNVFEYRFVLKPKEVSVFERQSKVNAALRERVEDLSATVATLKDGAEHKVAKIEGLSATVAEYSREMSEVKAMHTQEITELKAELKTARAQISGVKEEIGAKLDTELRTLKTRMASLLTQRTVTFFERITASKARTSGWSNIALNCGQFGYESAERCSFAQLSEGCVRITADGDYELAANCGIGCCKAFGMQLVVCGTDGGKRLLDAVGGGYHHKVDGSSYYANTSICRVDGVWLPIAAGSTITMRVYVGVSNTYNAYTYSCVFAEMKDKSMPVSSVSIRKLC